MKLGAADALGMEMVAADLEVAEGGYRALVATRVAMAVAVGVAAMMAAQVKAVA